MTTVHDFRIVVDDCVDRYEESWSDMDVLQTEHKDECAKSFIDYIGLNLDCELSQYLLNELGERYESLDLCSLWVCLDIMESIGYSYTEVVEYLCKYMDSHVELMEESYKRGRAFLDSEDDWD